MNEDEAEAEEEHTNKDSAWFKFAPNDERGKRTLEEQLMGLGDVLRTAHGKCVLDLGCAEGLIGAEFARAGARIVHGVENNIWLIRRAREVVNEPAMSVYRGDLNKVLPRYLLAEYEIVLALAILHKLRDPEARLRMFAAMARKVLVLRLPKSARNGAFETKHASKLAHDNTYEKEVCNTVEVMMGCGFHCTTIHKGPRGEGVYIWNRNEK